MLRSEALFLNGERASMERFCFRVATLLEVHRGQAVKDRRDIAVFRSECGLENGCGASIEGLGLREPGLVGIEPCQIADGDREFRMLGAKRFLQHGERSPEQCFRFAVASLVVVEQSHAVQDDAEIRVF